MAPPQLAQRASSQVAKYLRARYYDPATEQFLTRDPLVASTRSAYGYVAGNPLNGTDPTGLSKCGEPDGLWDTVGSLVDCASKGDVKGAAHTVTKTYADNNPIIQATGAMGICVNGSVGAFFGVSGSACLAVDRNGNFGLVATEGGGPEMLATASVGAGFMFSNADTLSELRGRSAYGGGSGGGGPVFGGDVGSGTKPCGGRLWTVNPWAGVGADLSQFGPVEEHAGVSHTQVVTFW